MNKAPRPLHEYLADVCEHTAVRRGAPLPMGTHESAGGVNFTFFSRPCDSRAVGALRSARRRHSGAVDRSRSPSRNRTGDVWHVWITGLRPGQLYGSRVDGPCEPRAGLRFNFNKLLPDPFATALSIS